MPNDYISKSALIKAVENERQITVSNRCNFKDIINTIPTVDTVSDPVKCEDCIRNDKNGCPFVEDDGQGLYTPLEIKYCGMGKRKGGESHA